MLTSSFISNLVSLSESPISIMPRPSSSSPGNNISKCLPCNRHPRSSFEIDILTYLLLYFATSTFAMKLPSFEFFILYSGLLILIVSLLLCNNAIFRYITSYCYHQAVWERFTYCFESEPSVKPSNASTLNRNSGESIPTLTYPYIHYKINLILIFLIF